MFDFLKKKISGFTDKLKETLQAKKTEEEPAAQEEIREEPEQAIQHTAEAKTISEPEHYIPEKESGLEEKQVTEEGEELSEEEKAFIEDAIAPKKEPKKQKEKVAEIAQKPAEKKKGIFEKAKDLFEKPKLEKPKEKIAEKRKEEKKIIKQETEIAVEKETKIPTEIKEEPAEEEYDIAGEKKSAIEKISEVREDEKRELKAKVGIGQKIFGFIGGKIKITEHDAGGFFDEFELSLLESDVEQETALAIVKELRERLVGKEISAKEDITLFLKQQVRESLLAVMQVEPKNILSSKKKPTVIMFLGPNGAGKTTTIAKIADYLLKKGKTSVIAAGDTFRAGAIDQVEEHAKRLGVKIVKHKYGADPAAVAFDAIKAAEAKSNDFVLIDTAGRQETNKNLLEELKKIQRVAKPDFKIYVGEAYTGQALLQQASEFDKAIGLDGFILTKIDADAKGGTAISLLYTLKKPILFVGVGQRYEDLLEFRPEFIVDRIL